MKEKGTLFTVQRFSEIDSARREQTLDEISALEKEVWPEEIQAPREKFAKRAEIFPEGIALVRDQSGKLVGASTSMRFNYDVAQPPISWEGITDNGWIEGTHDPNGDSLYVVSVGALPGQGAGSELVRAQIEFAKAENLKSLVLGARIPGYHQAHLEDPDLTIEQYQAKTREDGQKVDPEMRFYERGGLKMVKIVPNYMEDDPESENFGVVMAWNNPEKIVF